MGSRRGSASEKARTPQLNVRVRRERGLVSATGADMFLPTKPVIVRAARMAWPLPFATVPTAGAKGRKNPALPTDTVLYVHLVGPATSQRLNRDHRGKDKPTNVLSFPDTTPAALQALLRATGEPASLGELFICADVVAREAAEQGKPPLHHWLHMLVHGTLHLQGWDHESDAVAEAMEATERRLLAELGVPDPYADETDGNGLVLAGPAAV